MKRILIVIVLMSTLLAATSYAECGCTAQNPCVADNLLQEAPAAERTPAAVPEFSSGPLFFDDWRLEWWEATRLFLWSYWLVAVLLTLTFGVVRFSSLARSRAPRRRRAATGVRLSFPFPAFIRR